MRHYPASASSPRHSASRGPQSARQFRSSPKPDSSRSARASPRRCAIFDARPDPNFSPQLLVRDGVPDLSVVRSVLETRELMGPQIAVLAARRISAESARELDTAVDQLGATEDPVELQDRALAFWDVVVDSADSIAFRLIFNSFGPHTSRL